MAADKDFFKHQTDSSRVKASIVSEYFPQYCRIIRRRHEPEMFRYIDLFSGPGIYEDGNVSTPIMLARNIVQDSTLKDKVQFVFNDLYFCEELRANFEAEFPYGTFPKKAYFMDKEVGVYENIYNYLEKNTMKLGANGKTLWNEQPSLLFFDPFGYRGMRTDTLAKFLKNWGNEIFLFINTKRINPALENEQFEDMMRLWFPTRFDSLKVEVRKLRSVPERLEFILTSLREEFVKLMGDKKPVYCCAFRFQEEDSRTTSHYILHITKGFRGYDLCKSVYNKYANEDLVLHNGSNTYTFDPKKCANEMSLFGDSLGAVEALKELLCKEYRGKTSTALDLFETHQKTSKYSREHYTAAMRKAVKDGLAEAYYTDGKNHKVTVLIDAECIIHFN